MEQNPYQPQAPTEPKPLNPSGFPQVHLILLFAGVVVATLVYFVVTVEPEKAANLDRSECPFEGLPQDASRINYCFPTPLYSHLQYDFDISPEGFAQWAKYWETVTKLERRSGEVIVYYHDHRLNSHERKTIKQGVEYRHVEGDRGFVLTYDKRTGRAYYYSH